MKLLDAYVKGLSAKDKEKLLQDCEQILIENVLKDKASRG